VSVRIFTDRERKIREVVYNRRWRRNHPRYHLHYLRNWIRNHPGYMRKYQQRYRRLHPDIERRKTLKHYRKVQHSAPYKKRKMEWQRKAKAELRACYVRELVLAGVPPEHRVPIPEKLLQLKQLNLKIRRELWKNQKTLTS
jgi:hypothetical protein